MREKSNDPAAALSILKIIDGYNITAKLLIDTKIGKSLTAIKDEPDADRPTADDPETLKELTKMKAYLKNKWQSIHAAYKNKLKQQMNTSSRPPVPTEDRPQQA